MTGVQVIDAVNDYTASKDYEAAVEVERRTYSTNFRECFPKPIRLLHDILGKFPFRTLVCQLNQISFYDLHVKDEHHYIVICQKDTYKSLNPSLTKTGRLTNEELNIIDSGLGSAIVPYKKHVVTTSSCSCQFHKNWGLPCRHMLRVHFHLNWQSFDDVVVNEGWKVNSEVIKTCNLVEQRQVNGEKQVPPSLHTVQERSDILKKYSSLLVECSRHNENSFRETLHIMKERVKQLTGRSENFVFPNPKQQTTQHQKRKMPSNIGAPTGKASKLAGQMAKTLSQQASKKIFDNIINLN